MLVSPAGEWVGNGTCPKCIKVLTEDWMLNPLIVWSGGWAVGRKNGMTQNMGVQSKLLEKHMNPVDKERIYTDVPY